MNMNLKFVLGKKATQERRQNEETYRIQFENRSAGPTKRTRVSRIETNTTVNEPVRPKRTQSLAPVSYKQTKARRRKGTAVPRGQAQTNNLDTAQALAQAQEIQKIKKNIEKTRNKREKHVVSRRQKLTSHLMTNSMGE